LAFLGGKIKLFAGVAGAGRLLFGGSKPATKPHAEQRLRDLPDNQMGFFDLDGARAGGLAKWGQQKRSIKSRLPINTHTHVPIKQHPTDTPLFRRIIILLQKGT
jgi:hypothetical protein